MPVRIGKVELPGLQAVYAEEFRSIVEQRIPGKTGNVLQDLGREPMGLRLEGWMLGEDALDHIETLRDAQGRAQPLPFAADIAVGSDLVDVLIEQLDVHQPAGYRSRYWFVLSLREFQEPPEPPGVALQLVDSAVAGDAASWADATLGAISALLDPAALPKLLAENPDLLTQLSISDLAPRLEGFSGAELERVLGALAQFDEVAVGAVSALLNPVALPELLAQHPDLFTRLNLSDLAPRLEGLVGGELKSVLEGLVRFDADRFVELYKALSEAGSLDDILDVIADEGLDLFDDLTGIDLSTAGKIIDATHQGVELLNLIKKVLSAADEVACATTQLVGTKASRVPGRPVT